VALVVIVEETSRETKSECKFLRTALDSIRAVVCSFFATAQFAVENKEFSYRRETARCAVSVETVQNVAHMFVEIELHLISPETGE